jgi:hypothetical protein
MAGSNRPEGAAPMPTALVLLSGLCWTGAYLLIIRRGLADRTYGMPLVALCANLAWEFIFSVVRPHTGLQHAVDVVWLGFDLVIAFTAVRFGASQFPYLPAKLFYLNLAGALVLSYLGVDLVCREFDDGGGTYAAFGQNLMMSCLFLAMLTARGSLAGQSPWIALLKLVGTAAAAVYASQYGDHPGSPLLHWLYVAIFVVDVAYLGAVLAVGPLRHRLPISATVASASR